VSTQISSRVSPPGLIATIERRFLAAPESLLSRRKKRAGPDDSGPAAAIASDCPYCLILAILVPQVLAPATF
jgi:hypothetical protein